ncbi:MAG: phenylalanine--tRNA ligase subunit beta [Solirubrobacterales bacterium]|nr:phenylalanine--tRNA ligase subunit beta [Solirubrobacterales bacterium]
MRVPISWLHEHVVPELGLRELAFRLAMTGTEVDRIHHHGVDAVEHFVVGRVLTCEQHPDADRLKVCSVDVGAGEPQPIVCGAKNVAAGQTVAVARPGSVMPDGTKLKASKLRGVMSNGMICSEDELSLASDRAGGIYVFDAEHAPGTPLADVLPISDEVLELEITPNRPDCLGVYGVAREAHAATGAPLGPPPWQEDPGSAGPVDPALASVTVETERCLRFTARVFEDVTIAPSPLWLRARLLAAGQRPINNVVDITNYAMLLTGQPLHAFDLDRVAGGTLTVRDARAGETLTTLDGVERTLDPDVVLIEDADGPTSMAGVMGGERSEVEATTTRVLLEVATWDGPNINRTMAKFNLRSEAGARNEKGLAPEQALEAQAVATRLMLELTGAKLAPGTIDVGAATTETPTLRLRDARVTRLLGAPVERAESRRVLEALGFGVAETGEGLEVTVPSFRRNDVTREADVIEEVARLSALDTLPSTLPENRTLAAARLTPYQRGRRRAEDALVGLGLSEVAGWSFTNVETLAKLRVPDLPHVELLNPMSVAQAILRPTILGSLLDVAAHNVAHGAGELALFESAPVYKPGGEDGLADEHHALAALLHGPVAPGDWRSGAAPAADFFAVKGVLEHVLATLRVAVTYAPAEDAWPFLHPGRSAAVSAGEVRVGFVGEVHPAVAAAWDLPHTAAVFAVDLGKVLAAAPEVTTYADLTSFPSLRLDLAVVLDEAVPAARVLEVVRAAGGNRLADARVFDVYSGEQVGEGKRSLALHLEFRAADQTLTDADVQPARDKVVKKLASELGGELRG